MQIIIIFIITFHNNYNNQLNYLQLLQYDFVFVFSIFLSLYYFLAVSFSYIVSVYSLMDDGCVCSSFFIFRFFVLGKKWKMLIVVKEGALEAIHALFGHLRRGKVYFQ